MTDIFHYYFKIMTTNFLGSRRVEFVQKINSLPLPGGEPLRVCSNAPWFVKELSQNHSDSALAFIVGFAVCVPLILLTFKKVR
jgi:hypothetical protein